MTSCSPSRTSRSYSRLTSVAPMAVSSTAVNPSFCSCLFHRTDPHSGIICYKGGGQAYIYRRAGRNQRPGGFRITADLFRILRAVDETLSAEDAFIVHNVGLVVGKFNGLDRQCRIHL